MKTLRIAVVVLTVIVLAAGAVFRFKSSGKDDPPVIECSVAEAIEASVKVSDEELLSYVTASDKKDGDLTSNVVVTRKNFFIAPKTSFITYAVCDSDNNVTTLQKKLIFSDYRSPEIILTNDFIFPAGYSFDLSRYVTANDIIDGDITKDIKLISSGIENVEGENLVNIKVSNSMGDSTDLNVKAIITNDDYSQVRIRLNNYITYVTVGNQPDYASFISTINNKTTVKYKTSDITIDSSAVDITKPGAYDVFYRIVKGTGEDAETISRSRLVVVVREE
jgi:hypothetical protein